MKFLIEAENFEKLGGWLIDTASVNIMGSAYVFAHGLGRPVEDAQTGFECEAGKYDIYVRTRNWTAKWDGGHPAGRFGVGVDGKLLDTMLGVKTDGWSWENAGSVTLEAGRHTLSLRDLTGFDGKCDAIYFTSEGDVPPNDETLPAFRKEMRGIKTVDDPTEYDLIVCGGGMAGTCTALAAFREGLKVALINDRDVLGGCNSSEIRVGLGGMTTYPPYEKLGRTVLEIGPVFGSGATYPAEYYEDGRKLRAFLPEKLINEQTYREVYRNGRDVNVLLSEVVTDIEKDGDKITAVITENVKTGKVTRRRAKLFSDCTGEGFVARKAGCSYMYGREEKARWDEDMAPEKSDRLVMGMSVLWYSEDTGSEENFPDVDFGVKMTDETCINTDHGDWEWESGFRRDMLTETEHIRDYATMIIYANWSHLKNHSKYKDEYKNKRLCWVSPTGGKREGCRVLGDYILTQNDIVKQTAFPDATAAATWDMDQHLPEPKNDRDFDEPFRSCAYHRGTVNAFTVPYRCLYAKEISNLFLGGRIISVSHVAFSAVRVMRTLGTLGEAVGLASSVATKHGCTPREVYEKYLDEYREVLTRGVYMPQPHGYPPHSLESYHFKEVGNLNVPEFLSNPELKKRVDDMGIPRKHPDEFYFGPEWDYIVKNNGRPGEAVMPKVKK